MSLHIEISNEARAKLKKESRTTTIISVVSSLFVITLVAIILGLFFLRPVVEEPPFIVTYHNITKDEDEMPVKEVNKMIRQKPSNPSSFMAKVIASSAVSDLSIPISDFELTEPSLSFGDGNGFGNGWEHGDSTGASFFKTSVNANRVAFVIDFSRSMEGQRQTLMKQELVNSISNLSPGKQYQLIFFGGFAWVAGDRLITRNNTILVKTDDNKEYKWIIGDSGYCLQEGSKQQPTWITAGKNTIQESIYTIKRTELVFGTFWEPALELALNMDPPPEAIFFMTDGVMDKAEETDNYISELAVRKKIKINTFAMMEPQARNEMEDLAKNTGGEFIIIEEDGKPRKVELK